MIGRGNLLTSISLPSQDSGTLTAVMAVLCEWNGTDPQVGGDRCGPRCSQRAIPACVIRWRDCAPAPSRDIREHSPSRRLDLSEFTEFRGNAVGSLLSRSGNGRVVVTRMVGWLGSDDV